MRAAVYYAYGPAENFTIEEIEKPSTSKNEVLVKVHAASVNPIDWKVRKGNLKLLSRGKFPKVPGSDFSGVITGTGAGINGFSAGDKVYGMVNPLKGGANAQFLTVRMNRFAIMPQGLSFEEAAGVPMAGMTALQTLRNQGKIRKGQSVLVNGASGGVGSFGVQLAKIFGTVVTGVCSQKHLALVKSLGADKVINYDQEDFTEERGAYDIILDAVGKSSYAHSKKSLKAGGRYINVLPGPGIFFSNFITALSPGKKAKWMKLSANKNDLDLLTGWLESGELKVPVERVFRLYEIPEAHKLSEAGHAGGKIIVKAS